MHWHGRRYAEVIEPDDDKTLTQLKEELISDGLHPQLELVLDRVVDPLKKIVVYMDDVQHKKVPL
jgi:hypothetical protein